MGQRKQVIFFVLGFIFVALSVFTPQDIFSADVGNCLLCHKYPGLSRIDEQGKMKLLYVNEEIFNISIHQKVKCEGCHADIKKIPHDPVNKVDCLIECHIIEPSSEQKFSHKDVDTYVKKSVHASVDKYGMPKKYQEDMPTCKNCHDEPLYRPLSFFKQVRPGISDTALGRCRVCHKKEEFILRFYNHVTTRLHRTRNPINIAEVCARCHDDPLLVERHGLSTRAVFSYRETFHGKAAGYFNEKVPDCLDCHVNTGESVHQMMNHTDPVSITYKENRYKACANVECHPGASPQFASYKVHAEFNLEQSPVQYYFTLFFIILTGGTLLPLMVIIFLDLIRRLFPDAVIRRRR